MSTVFPRTQILSSGGLLVLCSMILSAATAANAAEAVDYAQAVAPLLSKYCAGCHNDQDREGGLSLESFSSLQKGSKKGPALLAGDAPNSKLIRVLTGQAEPKMPPEGEPAPTAEEITLLRQWIDAGAQGPDGAMPDRLSLIVPQIPAASDRQPVTALAVAPSGDARAMARFAQVELQRQVRVIDATSGKRRPVWKVVHTLTDFPGKVTAVHYCHGGGKLITASGVTGLGGVATLWEWPLKTKIREFRGHLDIMLDAEVSPDGQLLATCSYDRQIIIWNVHNGEQLRVLEGHNGAVYDVAFSPDSQFLVSASADDTCKVWRVSDGERLDTLGQPLKEQYAVLFSPDGQQIVAGGADNRIRVWSFVSRDKPRINPLQYARFAHEGAIVGLGFTPDGSQLVSVAENRTIKVWNTTTYEEQQLIENEPEVPVTMAMAGPSQFLVGRFDGSIGEHQIKDERRRERRTEMDPAAQPVSPQVNNSPVINLAEQEPNNLIPQAAAVTAPAAITGVIEGESEGQPDRDYYKFQAKAGEEWVIEVRAARDKSPLDSFVEVLDSEGNRIERVLLQAVRDSYFTFRGKDGNQSGDFRVFNWEEMELNEYLYANGEVVKLWLYPRGPDSGFNVYPGTGNRWGYFDTTGLAHPLGEPCYIVEPHPPGTELVPNGLPVFRVYYQNDDDAHRAMGDDSQLFFTAPHSGEFLVCLRDVRGQQGSDYRYTLHIRPRQPDFKVTVHNTNPEINAGSGKEFKVTVQRIDDYDGPVQVDITGVPAGFTVTSPIVIQEGQIEAYGVINAAADAVAPAEDVAQGTRITARGMIRGEEVVHDVNALGTIKLAERPMFLATIVPAAGGAVPVKNDPQAPLEFDISPGQTIMLKVVVERNGHQGEIKFGNEESGRNLPHGVIVDHIGLNGLMLLEGQTEREFFLTASKWVPQQTRQFHLRANEAGSQATRPVILHIRPNASEDVAERQ